MHKPKKTTKKKHVFRSAIFNHSSSLKNTENFRQKFHIGCIMCGPEKRTGQLESSIPESVVQKCNL